MDLNKEQKLILSKAIDKFGIDKQIEIVIEELLELACAIQKFKRERGNVEEKLISVIDEMADVTIVLYQAKIIFAKPNNLLKDRINFKIERLSRKLNSK